MEMWPQMQSDQVGVGLNIDQTLLRITRLTHWKLYFVRWYSGFSIAAAAAATAAYAARRRP